ncbi:MAG: Eco57I restriction-modification methylase domain-containing protein, partial [Candidatus Azobacteroides sp.]|nr:Eco57I restriction-modification methylase domain-containing protein [Candidatus Azobacteroides sp.]
MVSNIKSIKQALNPAFLKQKPDRKEIELFKKEFRSLLDKINEKESEEFHKNLIKDFLNAVYYKDKHYINTKDKTDLVIHNDKSPETPVGVLIEVKKPVNTTEMVSHDNLNVKSFQELLLYYLRERKTGKNFELRYLIVTNIYEWFVFDARNFEDTFGCDTKLEKKFNEFENKTSAATKTDTFYKEIAAPAINKHTDKIEFTHFDIRDYEKIVRNTDKEDDKQLISLYQFLSPNFLLKLPFANDNNYLNKEFYAELLHILGLEEITQDNRKLIVRKKEKERDFGSIIENTMERIDIKDKLSNLSNIEQFGKTKDEQLFSITFNLAITWINRILFLKLLESQILKYHNGNKDYAFLSPDKLSDYNDLDTLFFHVLARKENERTENIKSKFAHVPYLNSSLFEMTDIEDKTICIDSLQDNISIKLYSKSVLQVQNTMRPLKYLLKFLDAYDFSSEGGEEILDENKPLISASVLGLIFEKINGYKDGSFFTPSFITMYMCRETISRAVVQKFNEVKSWNSQTISDLHNLIPQIGIEKANEIFNKVRICDPAVGSGHFLVSALNEMLRLKAELGILMDKNGKSLWNYSVSIEKDELIVKNPDSDIFVYNPKNAESHRIQKTLFHEKQTIIENCLFGVDINPNSVKICQLRLWIELLKHTYYHSETNELETLPNIDINIKCGNSLISRFKIDSDIKTTLKNSKWNINTYKIAVDTYKNAKTKKQKRETIDLINEIKNDFQVYVSRDNPLVKARNKVQSELLELTKPQLFNFSESEIEEWHKKVAHLTEEIKILEEKIEALKNNVMYTNSFEWRFEFPEVLDDDGNFIGFDAVIGNPPYIQLQSMGSVTDAYKQMNYQVFERTGDIYCLFYELGHKLLKQNGVLSFITSNKWMRAGYGEKTRKFFVEQTNPTLLIDFAGVKVFDEATVDVNILMFEKDNNQYNTKTCQIKGFNSKTMKLSDYVNHSAINSSFDTGSISSFVILSDIEKRIK